MSDKNKKTPLRSGVATKTVVVDRQSSSTASSVPGYFPANSPSVLDAAPSDFEHIFHQPSVYMTPDGPVQAVTILPANLLATKKTVVSTAGKSNTSSATAPTSTTSKTSSIVKPVKMTTDVSRKTVVLSRAKAPVSVSKKTDSTSTVTAKSSFDMDAYLASIASPANGGNVVYTDPWTSEKVSMPRSPPRY